MTEGMQAIQAVGAVAPLDERVAGVGATDATSAPGGFASLISQGITQVNEQLVAAQADLQSLAAGNVQDLHQVMVRLEESRLSFQLLMQVRNRALEAYQEVMRMQV